MSDYELVPYEPEQAQQGQTTSPNYELVPYEAPQGPQPSGQLQSNVNSTQPAASMTADDIVAQGVVGGAIEGATGLGMMAAGATAGAALGGMVGGPFAWATAPIGGAIGAGAGLIGSLEVGSGIRNTIAELTNWTYGSIDDVPQEFREEAYWAEMMGNTIGGGFSIQGLARTSIARGSKGIIGKTIREGLDWARNNPWKFFASEAMVANAAYTGGRVAETQLGESPYVRAGGELVTALATGLVPTRKIAEAGRNIMKPITDRMYLITPRGSKEVAIRHAKEAIELAGEDPVALLETLRNTDPNLTSNVAAITNSKGLAGLQAKIIALDSQQANQLDDELERTLDGLASGVKAMQETGDPAVLQQAALTRRRILQEMLQARHEQTVARAQIAVGEILESGDDANSWLDVGQMWAKAHDDIVDEGRAIERELWGNIESVVVPTNELVGLQEVADTIQTRFVKQEIGDRIGDVALGYMLEHGVKFNDEVMEYLRQTKPKLLKIGEGVQPVRKWKTGKNKFPIKKPKTSVSTSDLANFRSSMLRRAREQASGANPNLTNAGIAGDIADGVLRDLNRSFDGSDAYQIARDFSYDLNESLTRSIVGKSLQRNSYGRTIPPELLGRKMIAGGPTAMLMRYQEIEEAGEFLRRHSRSELRADETIGYYRDLQARTLRLVANEQLVKADGTVNPDKVRNWMDQKHPRLMEEFPEVREVLENTIETTQGRIRAEAKLKGTTAHFEKKSRYAGLLKEDPVDLINKALDDRDPIGALNPLIIVARENGEEAVIGLRAAIFESLIEKSAAGDRTNYEKMSKLLFDTKLRQEQTLADYLVKRGVIDESDVARIEELTRVGQGVEEIRNPSKNFDTLGETDEFITESVLSGVAVTKGTEVARAAFGKNAGGHGLLLAQKAGSSFRWLWKKTARREDALADIMNDPALFNAVMGRSAQEALPDEQLRARRFNVFMLHGNYFEATEGEEDDSINPDK